MITDEMRKKWKDQIETINGAWEVGQVELNAWETDFFNSIHDRVIYNNQDLSWKQEQALRKIYEKIG